MQHLQRTLFMIYSLYTSFLAVHSPCITFLYIRMYIIYALWRARTRSDYGFAGEIDAAI